jgi:hypothetical protein
VTITSGGNGTTVFTVQTTAASSTAMLAPTMMKLLGLGGGTILAGLLMIGVPARKRRWMALMVLLWIVVSAGAIGCGGGRWFEFWIGWFRYSGDHCGHLHVPSNRNGFAELKHELGNKRRCDCAVSIAEDRAGVGHEKLLTPSMIE